MVKKWFEESSLRKWILIYDNADDIDMLYGKSTDSKRLADCFPRASNGAILLTTRNRKVGTKFTTALQNFIHVQHLTRSESVRLLKSKITVDADEEDYEKLGNALHDVPLALVQAAAFIFTESSSISKYLDLFDDSNSTKTELLCDDFEDDTRDKDTRNSVATTFAISFEQIEKSDPYAARILSHMSMLNPQAIPWSLLPCDTNSVISYKALKTLQAFSLITKSSRQDQRDEFYDLHRLVHLAMHEWLRKTNKLEIAMREATRILLKRFPNDEFHKYRETCRSYYPHALAILPAVSDLYCPVSFQACRSSQQIQIEMQVEQSDLLYIIAIYLHYEGRDGLAVSMMQKSLMIREKVLGLEHAKTLRSQSGMIWHMCAQGNVEAAINVGRDTLRLQIKTLGGEHPDTLYTMFRLAGCLSFQRLYGEAEQINRRLLELLQKVLGEQHSFTLASMRFSADILTRKGKSEEAELLLRRVLQFEMRVLVDKESNKRFSTLTSKIVSSKQDKSDVIEQTDPQSINLDRKILSQISPEVWTTMSFLAQCLTQQKKFEEAEYMAREVLSFQEALFGENHPATLKSMFVLIDCLFGQEKRKEAEIMARKVLSIQKDVLGEKHRTTLTTVAILTICLIRQKKWEEAETTARKALPIQKDVLGEELSTTLRAMSILTDCMIEQKKMRRSRNYGTKDAISP